MTAQTSQNLTLFLFCAVYKYMLCIPPHIRLKRSAVELHFPSQHAVCKLTIARNLTLNLFSRANLVNVNFINNPMKLSYQLLFANRFFFAVLVLKARADIVDVPMFRTVLATFEFLVSGDTRPTCATSK